MKVIMYFRWCSLLLIQMMSYQHQILQKVQISHTRSLFDVNETKSSGMGNTQGGVLIILHKADASDSEGGKTEL